MTSPPYTHQPDGTPIGDRTLSRPKDQDQDEPATPTGTQSRTLRWTGPARLTLRELRGWIAPIPDNAFIEVWYGKVSNSYSHDVQDTDEMSIFANWEVP